MSLKLKDKIYLSVFILVSLCATVFIIFKLNEFSWQMDADSLASTLTNMGRLPGNQGSWKVYSSPAFGFSFSYPKKLHLGQTAEGVELSHQIPFQNYGDCNMKGEGQTYPYLTDFKLNLRVLDMNVAQAAKRLSSYIPQENFQGGTLKVVPGYIDAYKVKDLSGFAIYEGVEGCGQTIYYFPLEHNQKTFVATKALVQLLSGVISSDLQNELLKQPGVISNEESNMIFENILSSLQFFNPPAQSI